MCILQKDRSLIGKLGKVYEVLGVQLIHWDLLGVHWELGYFIKILLMEKMNS